MLVKGGQNLIWWRFQMIPRFSLYGDPAAWKDDIQEDPQGRWVHWKDVEPYIQYCLDHGVSFDQPERTPMILPERLTDDAVDHLRTIDDIELAEDIVPMDSDDSDEVTDVLDFMQRNK
jgi:hypothetical protein